jgi:hypothetical protein
MGEACSARAAGDREKAAEFFMRSWLAGPHRTPSQVDPAIWARVREMSLPNRSTGTRRRRGVRSLFDQLEQTGRRS